MMPQEAEQWFDIIAPRNPMIGSDAGRNTNSVFAQIGKRLAVDTILEAARAEKNPAKPEYQPAKPSELAGVIKPI